MSTSVSLSMGQSLLLSGLAAIALVYVAYFQIWSALAIASDLLFAMALTVCVTCVVAPSVFDALSRSIIDRSPLPAALDDADAQVEALAALPGELIDRALERIGFGDDADGAIGAEDGAEAVSDPPLTPFETALASAQPATMRRAASDSTPSSMPSGMPSGMPPGMPPGTPAKASAEAPSPLGAPPRGELGANDSNPDAEQGVDGFFTRSIRPSVEGLVALVLRGSMLVVGGLLLILSLASRASTTTARRLRALGERIDAIEARRDVESRRAEGTT